ncbi:hypothetical protein DS745_01850 [Anaerobacillus alkaliphilus]|uniref:Uncharacterized protein n=1 Tax=Anaerobacillus alkaliphilus TaxID=1548597 RepID=A0A4Q0VWQ7_9BACI|nr:endospore germination permease [Anaerobacillus alkaliphilus]RXJ04153.1 hypothetical protein DS745_01850 [Anaerobacillus alkaliphilus]
MKVKIASNEFYTLLILFLLGSSIVVGLNLDTEENAWLVNLLSMVFGVGLFYFYLYLLKYGSWKEFHILLEFVFGRFIGRTVLLLYSLYFLYIGSRVVKDFSFFIRQTLFYEIEQMVISIVFVAIIGYALYLGLEAISRTSQILTLFTFLLLILIIIFSFLSDVIYIENVRPLIDLDSLELKNIDRWITFPYGEIVVFLLLLPLVNNYQKLMKFGWIPIAVSGLILIVFSEIIIAILGAKVSTLYTFPLVKAIEMIEIGGVIQHIEFLSVFAFFFVGFVKVCIFLWASTETFRHTFPFFQRNFIIFLLCTSVLVTTVIIADDLPQHLFIGLNIVPLYIHLPFQFVIPLIMLGILFIKNRKGSSSVNSGS